MRIFNSLIVPKNVKGGPLGFFNIHSVAKQQKNRRGALLKLRKNSKKKSQNRKKGRGKSHSAEKLEGGTLLGFAFQGRGLWMCSKSSTEYFW